ncbi:MAG TPA: hypothetical protein VMX97_10310 [Hyphomicrobiaceae bacterium]|nr:hypothetical protein [Hyphomicrobiaceae bacterium]
MVNPFLVDPASVLDWQHDWTDWLAAGDTIASRTWAIDPSNEGTPATPVLSGEASQTVIVSGLVAGRVYRLTEHVVTTNGVEADRTIVLRCDNR